MTHPIEPIAEGDELKSLKRQYVDVRKRIRNETGTRECARLVKQLEQVMKALFDADFELQKSRIKHLESQINEMRASQEKRESQRTEIIAAKIEQIKSENIHGIASQQDAAAHLSHLPFVTPDPFDVALQTPELTAPEFEIISDETKDGERKLRVRAMTYRSENRTMEVPYNVSVPQVRTHFIEGAKHEYTVFVPEQRTRREIYTARVPVWQELDVSIAKRENWREAAVEALENKELAKQKKKELAKKKRLE